MIAYLSLMLFTALAAVMPRRDMLTYAVFAVPMICIVGLRYEVGFDWTVYSEQFETFSAIPPINFYENFWYWVAYFRHEPLFILTSYGASQVFTAYELFQCAAYIGFVLSVFFLGRAIGGTNVMAAFIPIHLFLLFSLEFSTLRQMIAISTLNVALGMVLQGKVMRSLIFSILAPLFQSSTAIFVVVMYWAQATRRTTKIWLFIGGIAIAAINVIGFSYVFELAGAFLPRILAEKVYYYTSIREYETGFAEQAFWLVFYVISIYFCAKNRNNTNPAIASAATFTFYLSILALVGWTIPTVRNRFLYEIVILVSLLMFAPDIRSKVKVKLIIIPMGIFFFSVSLIKPTSFMYVPYQNYIWYQLTEQRSDGVDRQSRLDAIIQRR